MDDFVEIINAETAAEMRLPFYEGLKAGFPSPAADYEHKSLDFNRDFIRHPEATYYVRIKGDSMEQAGLTEGDLCLVDRLEEVSHGSLVVAFVNGGNTVKFLDTSTREQGYLRLIAANPKYKPFIIDTSDEFVLQGKVIFTIKDWRYAQCLP
ncbi:MAG: translesion error-prone DNA polymerase V autoproteolytic subunit [Prevotella sp.]|nr:translesion error-prone DNA polymerase V autoproteolytic subunit [Prevotella sp.]